MLEWMLDVPGVDRWICNAICRHNAPFGTREIACSAKLIPTVN